MRTPTLQYLYLQKPLTLILLIAAIALSPWTGMGNGIALQDANTFIAFLEALLFIGYSFVFFGKRLRLPETFTAALVLITAFAAQSYFFCNAIEMFFSLMLLIGIIRLFKWEEDSWKTLPWIAIICLSIACILKGSMVLFLAFLIFGIYLILLHYPAKIFLSKILTAGILSAIIPSIFFITAKPEWMSWLPQTSGSYQSPFFYLTSLLLGLFPWAMYLIFSIFGISPSAEERRRKKQNRPLIVPTETEKKVYLFSTIVIICTLIVFSIVPEKMAVNISVLYPFAALFIGRYATFLTEYRTLVTRIFGFVLLFLSLIISVGFIASSFGFINLYEIAYSITDNPSIIGVSDILQNAFTYNNTLHWALFAVLLFAQGTMVYQLGKKVNIKILYACIGLFLAFSFFFNWILFSALE
ncbi:MAG: hypothetical protein PUB21_06210 [Bacteroidales bacterium]|nr:hypothetical protein [Bacteroidales bacterium]